MLNLVLASKSKVRKEILEKNGFLCEVKPSNIDEEPVKKSLVQEGASPEIISKNLAELKANKVSEKFYEKIVLGADSIIDLNNEVISNLPLFTSECKFQTLSKLVKIKLSKIVPVLFKTPTTLYGCSAWTSPVSIKPCEPTKNLFIFKFVL